jgi:hypothetical protein
MAISELLATVLAIKEQHREAYELIRKEAWNERGARDVEIATNKASTAHEDGECKACCEEIAEAISSEDK